MNAAERAEALRRHLATADHSFKSLERHEGAWRWECTCGLAEPDWYVKANARRAWESHRDSWAARVAAAMPSA